MKWIIILAILVLVGCKPIPECEMDVMVCPDGSAVIRTGPSCEFFPCPEITSWEEAIVILNSGDVESVFQTHSLSVTIMLNDGTTITTQEPMIDDIFTEIDKCGTACAGISVATE